MEIILLLNYILPNYYWFYSQSAAVEAFQTEASLGITLFLFHKTLEGFYFIIFPIKIIFSLFAGALQKPNFASYETIFSYISQLIFLSLTIIIFLKKYFLKNINLFFITTFFLIIFSLPAISQHRYIFFTYEYFVIIFCLKNKLIKV